MDAYTPLYYFLFYNKKENNHFVGVKWFHKEYSLENNEIFWYAELYTMRRQPHFSTTEDF